MLQSRTSQELAEIRTILLNQQRQIDTLVRYVAAMKEPARARWERHSMPEMKDSDPALQATNLVAVPRLAIVSARPALFTLCRSGHEQFVAAYDQRGERIPALCGTFRQLGKKILQEYPDVRWEDVTASA